MSILKHMLHTFRESLPLRVTEGWFRDIEKIGACREQFGRAESKGLPSEL